jgi:hypothetical protein
LLALFCWLQLLATVPHFHHCVHGSDASSESHHCVVSLIGKDHVLLVAGTLPTPEPPQELSSPAPDTLTPAAGLHVFLPRERAPPSILA